MDEKDRQIERLFDDYASSIEPNAHLANKAKQKMQAKRKNKRPIFWVGLVSAVAAAAAIAVFSVSSFFGNVDNSGDGPSNDAAPNVPPISAAQSYSISEVRAVSVDYDFAKDYINTIDLGDAEVYSQTYYACYVKDTDEFAYLKAVLGVSYNGGNIQMSVVAEKPEYECTERVDNYKSLVNRDRYGYYTEYINGEYVTMAYCKTKDCKYYVSAMGNVMGAHQIAAKIIGQ